MEIETEVIIYRNRSVVFEHLTDPERLRNWVDDFVSSTPASELSPNAPYFQAIRVGRSDETMQGRVNQLIKDQVFAFTLSTSAIQIAIVYQLSPHDGEAATRLKAIENMTPRTFLARLMIRVLMRSARKKQAADLRRLKTFLDQGGDKP